MPFLPRPSALGARLCDIEASGTREASRAGSDVTYVQHGAGS